MKKAIEYMLLHSGISNYQISKATGIGETTLSRYATGKTDIDDMSLGNAIKIHKYFKEMLITMEKKFGSVTFEGKEYILAADAGFTSRQLLDWQTEDHYAELSAPAIDQEGQEYTVYWILKTVYENGEGIEDLEDLDWDDVHRVDSNG